MRRFWQLILATRKALGAVGSAIAILYFWPNIKGLPAAYGLAWDQVMPDRESLSFILLGCALAWIVWMDARPTVKKWLDELNSNDQRHAFAVSEYAYCESARVVSPSNKRPSSFYDNIFYIKIGNNLTSGQTLRRVRARIYQDEPVILPAKGTDLDEVDIHHGEWVYFELGRVVDGRQIGLGNIEPALPDVNMFRIYENNIPNGFLFFEMSRRSGGRGPIFTWTATQPNIWSALLLISGDDVIAMSIRVDIDLQREQPVSCKVLT